MATRIETSLAGHYELSLVQWPEAESVTPQGLENVPALLAAGEFRQAAVPIEGPEPTSPVSAPGSVTNPVVSGTGEASGSGAAGLIAQYYDAADGRYEFSGNQDIDAVLIGSRWTVTNITYSFPTSGTFYAGQGYAADGEADNLIPFNAAQQAAARYALGLVQSYTAVTFTEITETETVHANLRLAQTSFAEVQSAYGMFPSSLPNAGDIWFGTSGQPFYSTPAIGNWGQATIMHEFGHALGLKHGHDSYTNVDLVGYVDAPPGGGPRYGSAALPSAHDGQAWSLMTYRSDPANSLTFQGDGENQPQTYMQNDIAALQHLYGANFGTNGGNTVYRWDPDTGRMSIDGVGQGTPSGNVILMTLWDGNGTDTYDLSNYETDLRIDLRPGQFSTFSDDQLANHRAYSGGLAMAPGNVANALLYEGDARSLIENAIGGSGDDSIVGNQAVNRLTGGLGGDTLAGDAGSDVLLGSDGSDLLYGDGTPGMASGIGFGTGSVAKSGTNSSLASAQDVTSHFSLLADPDIANATTVAHVSITATGTGTRDYYKVTVAAGVALVFDIDRTSGTFDSFIKLYGPGGAVVAFNDDSLPAQGAGGSTRGQDSYLTYTTAAAGSYTIEVGRYVNSSTNGPIQTGRNYELQISVSDVPGTGGGNGDDRIDGGVGADSMHGGAGNDTFLVDNAGDRVFEAAGEGIDLIESRVTFSLAGQAVENLTLKTAQTINGTGNELANHIVGNNAKNLLDGGSGSDTLEGGLGNDTYIVDDPGDRVIEADGQGTDLVESGVTFSLAGQSLEKLTLTGTGDIGGTGNALANTLTGNAGANVLLGDGGTDSLDGGDGSDSLDGGSGADTLRGGAGNDSYVIDDPGDRILETDTAAGMDVAWSSVSLNLAGTRVESLILTGSEAIDATGNAQANLLTGNAGANLLTGLGGADQFIFAAVLGGTNIDTIADFSSAQRDRIVLENDIFTGLADGGLDGGAFREFGAGVAGGGAQVLYDRSSGGLFFDADGVGTGDAIQFALLSNHALLSAGDFLVI